MRQTTPILGLQPVPRKRAKLGSYDSGSMLQKARKNIFLFKKVESLQFYDCNVLGFA
jgi:hypothetical protein